MVQAGRQAVTSATECKPAVSSVKNKKKSYFQGIAPKFEVNLAESDHTKPYPRLQCVCFFVCFVSSNFQILPDQNLIVFFLLCLSPSFISICWGDYVLSCWEIIKVNGTDSGGCCAVWNHGGRGKKHYLPIKTMPSYDRCGYFYSGPH